MDPITDLIFKVKYNLDKFILNTRVFYRAKRLMYYLALNDFTVLCDIHGQNCMRYMFFSHDIYN
jgi:hypothetical protein